MGGRYCNQTGEADMPSALAEAHAVIRSYSVTWFEPVTSMPAGLNEATSSAYLLMRAIDEIEDHPELATHDKDRLLRGVSGVLQERCRAEDFTLLFSGHKGVLPDVSLRIAEWAQLAPSGITARVCETFATMAERMAAWALAGWRIRTEGDLDRYTYAVAGELVLLLSDLWAWHDGTRADRTLGIGYGRALQAVNIYIDKDEDLGRGVGFWPDGWTAQHLKAYAKRELVLAEQYVAQLPQGPARRFCTGPLERAQSAVQGPCR